MIFFKIIFAFRKLNLLNQFLISLLISYCAMFWSYETNAKFVKYNTHFNYNGLILQTVSVNLNRLN